MSDVSPQSPQEAFAQIQKKRRGARDLRAFLREQYESVPAFVELTDQKKALLERIKVIKEQVHDDNVKVVQELEDVTVDLKNLNQLLADMLLAKVTNNEPVEIRDDNNQLCLPIFSVKLKKD